MGNSVLILGGGVGGLSAAIYSKLSGHDVLLLEKHDRVGGKAAGIEIGGYKLDPGPSIIILKQVYEDLFTSAGRRMESYLEFRPLPVLSRVFVEGEASFDLPAGREASLDLARHLWPEDAKALDSLLCKLDEVAPLVERTIFKHAYSKPWQLLDPALAKIGFRFDPRKSYKQLIDGWFQSTTLRAFFYGFPSYGGQSYDSKAAGALLIPYYMLQEGVYYPSGGVAAIPRALEKLAKELGVEIRTGFEVSEVSTAGQRLTAVHSSSGERVEAEKLISNVDYSTFRALLGRPESRSPSFSYFTLHWGIPEFQAGLAHHNLFIPSAFEEAFTSLYSGREFPKRPIVYVNETSGSDPSNAPPGAANLFAVVTSPAKEAHLEWPALEREARKCTLETLDLCGLQVPTDSAEFERIQSPPYFETAHGNYLGSLYGLDEGHRLFGLFPPVNRDPDFRNLFYCGGSVQPGAGLPMVLLSGKFAAEQMAKG